MILAKDKHGRIGRQIPGVGELPRVASAPEAEHRRDLYLSTRSIEADQAHYAKIEQERNAMVEANRLRNIVKRNAERIARERRAEEVERQSLGSYNPMTEKLRAHFAKQKGMGETESVVDSLFHAPADFSQSGGNPQYVPSEEGKRPIVWRADFQQQLIVGNPLTRDGEYGPEITDYDRYVNGVDVNETNVVAGGTMLGRYNGSNAEAGMGNAPFQARRKVRPSGVPYGMSGVPRGMRGVPAGFSGHPLGMGFDFSWGGITDWVSGVAEQTVDNLSDSLPDQIAKELQDIISGGGDAHVNPATGQIVVTRPVTGTTTTVAQSLGVPPWAIYAGLGLMGVGVLFVLIKAVKS